MPRLRTRCERIAVCSTRFSIPRKSGEEGRCDKCLAELGISKSSSDSPKSNVKAPLRPIKRNKVSVLDEPYKGPVIWPQDDIETDREDKPIYDVDLGCMILNGVVQPCGHEWSNYHLGPICFACEHEGEKV